MEKEEIQIKTANDSKNMWLEKLKKDLLQNRYNLKKIGLYNGMIENGMENLFLILKDYDV